MYTPSKMFCLIAVAGSVWCGTAAFAAGKPVDDAAQVQYQQDVARCESGATGQDKADCLREAGAARDEARRNALSSAPDQYDQNRLARCQALPPADRDACVKRMNYGTTSGSVEGGGVLREYREITIGTPGQRQ